MWFCMISRVVGAAKLCLFSAAVESIQVSAGTQQPSASQSATQPKISQKKKAKKGQIKRMRKKKAYAVIVGRSPTGQQPSASQSATRPKIYSKWKKKQNGERVEKKRMNDSIVGMNPTTAIGKLIYRKIQNGQKMAKQIKNDERAAKKMKKYWKMKTLRKIQVSAGAQQSSTSESLEWADVMHQSCWADFFQFTPRKPIRQVSW